MAGRLKKKREVDQKIEREYYRYASGKQIGVMDIAKVYQAGHAADLKGESVEAAVRAAVDRYATEVVAA